ncbi:MAG: helix-turn-helix domain-containing protein, partial [Hyphomonas oceanitis]
ARTIEAMFIEDAEKLKGLGRAAPTARQIFRVLQTQPLVTIATAAERAGVSFPSANTGLQNLQKHGIVSEVTGRTRGRVFAYTRYLDLLSEGTEPLA